MIEQHEWVWWVLRIVIAWMYLVPVAGLISNWDATKTLTRLISPVCVNFLSGFSIFLMVLGALSILLGVYAQIGGILLLIYTLFGILVHFRLAKVIQALELPEVSRADGGRVFDEVKSLGEIGQITSAQKNVVLAAVALLFVILGSGSLSITGNLW